MDPNEKIQLDDITFDDVITGDGVAVDTIDEIEPIEEAKEEVTEEVEKPEAELEDSEDNDEEEAEEEQEEEQEEEEVEEKEETEEEVSEPTVVSEILSSLGYEGEYEDTAEGLTELKEKKIGKRILKLL